MKSQLLIAASLSNLIAAGVPFSAGAFSPDQTALRSRAEAEFGGGLS
jgi:hypothetical protein